MAGLNLQQIKEHLNEQFAGHGGNFGRILVFWYDPKQDFLEEIDSLVLDNATIYKLHENSTFGDKLYLTKKYPDKNFLLYAPFARPEPAGNQLEDMLNYSKVFSPDKNLLIMQELGLDSEFKYLMDKYQEFFKNKERVKKFKDLAIQNYTEKNIVLGMLAAIAGVKTCDFNDTLRNVLTKGLEDNSILLQFYKFHLLDDFWGFINEYFGYFDTEPSLKNLLVHLFINVTEQSVQGKLPAEWEPRVNRNKAGNISNFLSDLMYNMLYADTYRKYADLMERELQIRSVLSKVDIGGLLDSQVFPCIDEIIINWVITELNQEDIGVRVKDKNLAEICQARVNTYFGKNNNVIYNMLINAYHLVGTVNYIAPGGVENVIRQYVEKDYLVDQCYRKFYFYFDKIEDKESVQLLREKVENIYTNIYLGSQLVRWNQDMSDYGKFAVPMQQDFYKHKLANEKSKTVVIISDAMRYEVGQELYARFKDDERCMPKLEYMLSTLPSYTALGKAALLPHNSLTMTDTCEYLCDNMSTKGTLAREKILQKYRPKSVCRDFVDVSNLKKDELRENVLNGQEVIYIYHDWIDTEGEKKPSEHSIFDACQLAIDKIYKFVHYVGTNGNTYHFLITSDHGFLYKRDELIEADKITVPNFRNKDQQDRRFVIDGKPLTGDGVGNVVLGQVLRNDDRRIVSFPIGSSVLKTGGGMNYVHGGSSPQEMIVPLLEIKMEKGHMDAYKASLGLVSTVSKITNLFFNLDFIQKDPVGENIKEASYMAYFVREGEERISDVVEIVANSRETDGNKRIIRKKFSLIKQAYDRHSKYYLVVKENNEVKESNAEVFRREFNIDLAFSDNFGF